MLKNLPKKSGGGTLIFSEEDPTGNEGTKDTTDETKDTGTNGTDGTGSTGGTDGNSLTDSTPSGNDNTSNDASDVPSGQALDITSNEVGTNTTYNAPGDVNISDFKDQKFGTYIVTTYDKNGDNKLDSGEVAAITNLSYKGDPNDPISTLEGIGLLGNLKTLELIDCKGLGNENLSDLGKLETLTISTSTLSGIVFPKDLLNFKLENSTITGAAISGNDFEFKVSGFNKINKVEILNNNFYTDGTHNCVLLVQNSKYAENNGNDSQIIISGNTFDDSGSYIYVRGNDISGSNGINVTVTDNTLKATDRAQIDVQQNDVLDSLTFTKNTLEGKKSNYFNLKNNTCKSGISFEVTDNKAEAGMPGIDFFVNNNANLDSLDFEKNTNVGQLQFFSNWQLTKATVKDNTIGLLAMSDLSDITNLDCSNNGLTQLNISSQLPKLTSLDCSNNDLSTLDDTNGNLPALQNLKVNGNAKLTKLNLKGKNLSTVDITGCANLEEIDVSFNQLSSFDVTGLSKLKKLHIQGNQLAELNVGGTLLQAAVDTINASSKPEQETVGSTTAKFYKATDGTNECWFDATIHVHNPVLTAQVNPTCTKDGTLAYYECKYQGPTTASCQGNKYADVALTTQLTNLVIPAIGHNWAGWNADAKQHSHQCNNCSDVETGAHVFNGGLKCSVCGYQKAPTVYSIIKGDRQILVKGSIKDTTISCDGEFGKFTGLAVNGNVLSSSDYSAVSGSTIATLKATYLNTLPLGKYKVQFFYTDGSATGEFSIIPPEVPSTSTDSFFTPKTGDETNMLVWLGLMFISGLGVVTFVRRKAN